MEKKNPVYFFGERPLSNVPWYAILCISLSSHIRATVPEEEQEEIWEEVGERLEDRDKQMRKVAAKRAFVRPVKKL